MFVKFKYIVRKNIHAQKKEKYSKLFPVLVPGILK